MTSIGKIKAFFLRLSITTLTIILIVSALTRVVSASLATLADEAPTEVAVENTLLCQPSDEVANLLEQIAARDRVLSDRENELALREQDIEIARQEIAASLARMAEAEERLAARMEQSATASAEDVARLVAVYEGMKPKDAAVLFEAMAPDFAAGFLARMRPDAASALFSNLSPERAYALSVIMAGRNANAATE